MQLISHWKLFNHINFNSSWPLKIPQEPRRSVGHLDDLHSRWCVAAAPPKPSPITPFRFLDLPGDIRNRIYRNCLVEPKHLQQFSDPYGSRFQPYLADLHAVGIVRALKQTQAESLPLLVGANTWRVYDLNKFCNKVLWPMQSDHLRALHLVVQNCDLHRPLQVCKEDYQPLHFQLAHFFCSNQPLLSGLKELHLVLHLGGDYYHRMPPISRDARVSLHIGWKLTSRQVKKTLIVRREVWNLVRMKLLKEHELSSARKSFHQDSYNIQRACWRKYTVSLQKPLLGQVRSPNLSHW